MRKIIVFVCLIGGGLIATAQVAKKKTVPVQAQVSLKTLADSLSYAIGLSVADFYKVQGIQTVNTSLVTKAINDVMRNGKPLLNEQQANGIIMGFIQKEKDAKASGNKLEGQAFLSDNKNKPGVVTLPSGLQYLVIKDGTGPKPVDTSRIQVHYHGTLLNGKVFDSSIERGQPIEINVNGVIPGWTEALKLMSVGSKWRLFIPSDLAYGDSGSGPIPAGATLIFDVELLKIIK